MPHLTDLQGDPLAWSELLRRNEAWWAGRDRDGQPLVVPRPWLSGDCTLNSHRLCKRRYAGADFTHKCECRCHDTVATNHRDEPIPTRVRR